MFVVEAEVLRKGGKMNNMNNFIKAIKENKAVATPQPMLFVLLHQQTDEDERDEIKLNICYIAEMLSWNLWNATGKHLFEEELLKDYYDDPDAMDALVDQLEDLFIDNNREFFETAAA